MVQRNIRFMTTGQLMTFCNVCQKMNADITVKDVTGRFEIDAKSIVGLMTIRMGEKINWTPCQEHSKFFRSIG